VPIAKSRAKESAQPPLPLPEPEPEPEPNSQPQRQPQPEPEPELDGDSDDESVDYSSTDSDSSDEDSDDGDVAETTSNLQRPGAATGADSASASDADSSTDSDSSDDDTEEDEDDELGVLDAGPSLLAAKAVNRDEIKARGGGRRRNSVSAESTSDVMRTQQKLLSVLPKTDAQKAAMASAIAGNILFANMDDKTRATVYESMFQKSCGPGKSEVIIKQGDSQADYFYIIESGKCGVAVDGQQVATLGKGQSFGELALMYFAPRAATVAALEPTVLWVMDRMTFR
jgi:uncharacterized cupin superfamily protein